MTWLAIAFIGLGLADLVGAAVSSRVESATPPAWPSILTGVVAIGLTAWLAGVHRWADVPALVVMAAALTAWTITAARTQLDGERAMVPLSVLGGLVLALVGFSGWASPAGGALGEWLRWADLPALLAGLDVGRTLLLAGLVLVNLATGNVVVRLVLLAIGALHPEQVRAAAPGPREQGGTDHLKGGRLLGPMERLVILGLGLAGEYGAASIVIAAKGLLRFPEIQAAARSGDRSALGIDDVTEYFLVGSFVSWLVALVSLAIAR